eukprot:m.230388 g.230388  ORF g.230388 m.230388 type:complete len:262 (-) comp54271_c0_seq9:124-909(-)
MAALPDLEHHILSMMAESNAQHQRLGRLLVYQYAPGFGLPSVDPKCLVLHAYLRFAGIEYETVDCHNEFMAPQGSLPFVRCASHKDKILGSLQDLIAFAKKKGRHLVSPLSDVQQADLSAFIALIETYLAPALEYQLWCIADNFEGIALPVFGQYRYAFPLSRIHCWLHQRATRRNVLQYETRSEAQVLADAEHALIALSDKLDGKPFFFGQTPTELDAVLYGYLALIKCTPFKVNPLGVLLDRHPELVSLYRHVHQTYFA